MRPFVLLISLLFLGIPLSAQEVNFDPKSDIALEVFQMTESLEELIQLLKEGKANDEIAAELQKLEIAVNYLSFRSRRIESKEQDLRDKKLARDRIKELVAKIKDNPEQWERFDNNTQRQSQTQQMSQESPLNYRLRQLVARAEALDSEIITLEMDIADLNGDINEFEEFVERKLKMIQ